MEDVKTALARRMLPRLANTTVGGLRGCKRGCTNTCTAARNGRCTDGWLGDETGPARPLCALGTDCAVRTSPRLASPLRTA